ncbi:putative ABC transporter substrate-binding protein YesO [Paenibacillus albidus]|uniref:ABC transporter substrate-binding protein YesO n=1 Tax=Paenibacillus albidus TaxID=2041023 RepID=A0A917FVZ6_9BACL|nr:extracellular solute-binding protein [Paenibacillus albidus]GGG13281.1 putative ABC transporter substrate-binding protein YesO [Paenibacillus albidus]
MSVNRQKRLSWVLVSVLVLTVLAACNNSNEAGKEKATEADKAEEINLKFIWWGKEQRKEDTLKVIELYKKDHPNVNIETEDFGGTNDVSTQLAMETADQNTADIIQGDYGFIFNYINRDLIEPLGPHIENKNLSIADVSPATLAPGMKDNELYAVSIGINSEALLYDPAFFEKEGVEVPAMDYTLDDLYKTLVQLKEAVNEPDFYPLGNMFDVSYYLRAKGVSMYNAEGTGLGYEDDKYLEEYLALYKKWVDEGLISSGSTKRAGNDADHPLITGKAALYSVSSNASTLLSKIAGRTLQLLPLPEVTKGIEGKFIKPSMFLAVSSYSKHPEEAAKFIDFFINNKEANGILNGERGVPVSGVIAKRLSDKLDEAGKQQYELLDYLSTHSAPIDPPAPSSSIVVNNAYQLILKRVMSGTTAPAKAAQDYRTEAEGILQGKKGAESK